MTATPFNTRLKAEIIEELDAYAETAAADAAASAADAANSVGAVLQVADMVLQPDAGVFEGAWYSKFFVSTDTTYTLIRYWIYLGSGTAEVSVNVNDENYLGPYTVTTTAGSSVIDLAVSEGDRVSFQVENITGTPGGLVVQMEGLPT